MTENTTAVFTPEYIDSLAQPLFESMTKRVSDQEMALIHKAFDFAREAHKDQKRKTGHPYIIHPIAVASIVGEELMLGANPVCAAFLHDVVEDTPHTIEEIEQIFGADVAFLVNVVTKKKKEHYDTSLQVDNFRQMLESINFDIRALLIKLADRLHNMRTLSSMPPDKQMKIAGETDYFFAPLANRLGLYRIKIELENLSFRYRCPREYAKLEAMLIKDELDTKPVVDSFIAKIDAQLRANGIEALIESDYRKPFSVRRKMLKTGQDFAHVENRYFVRVVFGDTQGRTEKEMALKIYSLLTDVIKEKPGSMLNYIDSPKENGYQSLHVKLLDEAGQWTEVHISSERMRRVSRLGCVAEREENNITRWIDRLKSTLEDIAKHGHEIGFMEGVVTSFYNDDIMVFTPTGQPVTLPQRSTALDFAFEIHSELGLHAQYARINGALSSVKTPLRRGDCVEIATSPDIHPKPDWLNHVLTYKAKRGLRSYFGKLPRSKVHRCEYCHPLPGDEVVGFEERKDHITIHKRDCQHMISAASQHGESVKAIDFAADPKVLYPVTLHIRAVDRFHLFSELIDCITNELRLPIAAINTSTVDEIVDCTIEFSVHSYNELQTVIDRINPIPGVEEVWHREK